MSFTVRATYTRETVDALVALSQRRSAQNPRLHRLLSRALGALLTLTGAAGALLFLLDFFGHISSGRGYSWERFWPVLPVLLFLWTGLALLLEGPRLRRRREQWTEAIWKSYPDKGQEAVFRFTAEGFTRQTPAIEAKYQYSLLRELATDGAYYFLYLNDSYAYVLRKADFTEGDPEAFGTFLSGVTGKPLQVFLAEAGER